jgi:hypothetical protein
MKKVLLIITLLAATAAQAQWRHDHRHWEPPRTVIVEQRNDWIGPLIIGGIAGAVIANANQPQPVVVQREQVIVQQPQTICTAWKEILMSDGQIYRERNCYQR